MSQHHAHTASTHAPVNYKMLFGFIAIAFLTWLMFHLSLGASLSIVFVLVCTLAIYERMQSLHDASKAGETMHQSQHVDGGSFSLHANKKSSVSGSRVVADGGSFKHS